MNETLNDVEFENQIKGLDDRQLSEFTARQSYNTAKRVEILAAEISCKASKKLVVWTLTGIGTLFTGVVIYVLKHIGFPQ